MQSGIFDAEAYAIYQALCHFEDRNESSVGYTIFSDSAAAISRTQTDRTGPGQAFARAMIEASERLRTRRSQSLCDRHWPTKELSDKCLRQRGSTERMERGRPAIPAGGQPRLLDKEDDRGTQGESREEQPAF